MREDNKGSQTEGNSLQVTMRVLFSRRNGPTTRGEVDVPGASPRVLHTNRGLARVLRH
jgi:hypothetical protein